jgi:WD40 repeat protein
MALRTSRIELVAIILACFTFATAHLPSGFAADESKPATAKISYFKDVRPIFQAHCQGCHQPAKAGGGYVMTDFAKLLGGGDSGDKAVVAGKLDESNLLDQITPQDGKAAMPKGKNPLTPAEIDIIKRWIADWAADDTPANAKQKFDMDHPPVYVRPPVIGSIDYSPDGSLLAIAGFNEVLLFDGEGNNRLARLVGMSEKIESVKFSPDGKRLAVTGGSPGRFGEVQVWDVAERKLTLSVPITFDTVYGANWSPDGKLISFGCADNSVRAIDSTSGAQMLFQGAHSDWVLDTIFSKEGTNLISVSRDRTTKLTELATQRFIDNISSITPGALRGGIGAVARHPERDEIVIGGSDGVPKVYRVFRVTVRVIGDDANLIKRLPAMPGRVAGVAVSADGKRIAAGSSLDGSGEVIIVGYEFDTGMPDNIKAINQKVSNTRSAEENATLEKYVTEGVQLVAKTAIPTGGVYAVAFRPDGKLVAAAGADGVVRFIDAATGAVAREFSPAPVDAAAAAKAIAATGLVAPLLTPTTIETETLPDGAKLVGLSVEPNAVRLVNRFDYAQLIVTGKLESGDTVDVTRLVTWQASAPVIDVSKTGLVRAKVDGDGQLVATVAGQTVSVAVTVAGVAAEFHSNYIRDVAPVMSKLGCTAGTCHGSAQGKNGFKLSLRGYDPLYDVRALTDEQASRRVNVASPEDSLMLDKPTGAVPHVGGALVRPGEPYYEIIRNWIASGAKLDLATPRVTKIDVLPNNPIVQRIGSKQQMRVLATYADGRVRDVTQEAFLESGNGEVATADRAGLMTTLRRGEAPVLARFEGAYAASTLTVMGDRTGFVWQQPAAWNRIDELSANKWQRMKIQPSELCSDDEFIRRVYLDLTGLPPSSDDVRAFLADQRETRVKRDELIDRLVGSESYIDHWTNKWADLLQVNRKFLGPEGAAAFRKWIRNEVALNTPYDQLAGKILTASGSNRENPAASYFKILRDPTATMENTTHLFLAVRFNCNQCHDHPFERWTQDQYFQTSAFFAQVGLQRDPVENNPNIGGTAVEGAKPMYEIIADKPDGEVTHGRTAQIAPPQFPYNVNFTTVEKPTRRQQLAAWITSRDNQYFAKSYVNRLWGYLFGVGIMEPIDDIRAGNPPTNPELLAYLTDEFLKNNFDVRSIVKLICKSRTYQLSVDSNQWNKDDKINYSHAIARRLPAEVLYDAVHTVTGAVTKIPGVPAGTRAAALPDSAIELPSGFFTTFGRPPRESACECERTSGLQLGPVMALISGPTVAEAIADPGNELAKLVAKEQDDRKVVNEIFLRVLNRSATDAEIDATLREQQAIDADHAKIVAIAQQKETEYAPVHAQKEKDREVAMAKAKEELETYDKDLQPKLVEAEKQRVERLAKAEADLKAYEEMLGPKLTEWEKQQTPGVAWTLVDARDLKANTGAKLTKEADGAIFAERKDGPSIYTVTADTDLKGITGVQLEALADDRLPARGPGLSDNGNFVLTELDLKVNPKGKPQERKVVKLENAEADFSQQGFDIKTAVDDNRARNQNGWASAGQLGVSHWAKFEIKEPVGFDEGTVLTFTLEQRYVDRKHSLGKFRLWVTTAAKPIALGLPAEISTVLATPADQRNDQQKATLLKHFAGKDEEWRKKSQAVAEAKKPLPPDAKLAELKQKLATVSQPVQTDPKIVQLRSDLAMSTQQQANKRLTMVQDLAWVLINSPSFLFNH